MTHNSTDCSGMSLAMSEFCDFAHAEFCAELDIVHRIGRHVQN